MSALSEMLDAFANAVTDADTVGEVMDLVEETAPRFEKWRSTPREGEVMAYGFPPIPKEPVPLDRIATALERLVELAEQVEPEMDVDIEIDADGKLMHVTAEGLARADTAFDTSMHDLSAYVLAHDPDAAARAAKTWWIENGHFGITGVKVNYDHD